MTIIILTTALFSGLALALIFAGLTARWRIAIDLTPIEHALIAAAVQVGWGLATGDWIAGGAMGVLLFIGREHAQAEYRYLKAHGGNPRSPLACLHPRYWNMASVLDLAAPLAAVCAIAYGATHATI